MAMLSVSVLFNDSTVVPAGQIFEIDEAAARRIADSLSGIGGLIMPGEIVARITQAILTVDALKVVDMAAAVELVRASAEAYQQGEAALLAEDAKISDEAPTAPEGEAVNG